MSSARATPPRNMPKPGRVGAHAGPVATLLGHRALYGYHWSPRPACRRTENRMQCAHDETYARCCDAAALAPCGGGGAVRMCVAARAGGRAPCAGSARATHRDCRRAAQPICFCVVGSPCHGGTQTARRPPGAWRQRGASARSTLVDQLSRGRGIRHRPFGGQATCDAMAGSHRLDASRTAPRRGADPGRTRLSEPR